MQPWAVANNTAISRLELDTEAESRRPSVCSFSSCRTVVEWLSESETTQMWAARLQWKEKPMGAQTSKFQVFLELRIGDLGQASPFSEHQFLHLPSRNNRIWLAGSRDGVRPWISLSHTHTH